VIDLRAEGRRRVFVFKDRPERRNDVIAFHGEGGNVGGVSLCQTGQFFQ
jgi:hypothetical protein